MSVHTETLHAPDARIEYVAPGVEVGGYILDNHALIISGDDAWIITGTPAQLRTFSIKIEAAFAAGPTPPPQRCTGCGDEVREVNTDGHCRDCAELAAEADADAAEGEPREVPR
jgi:hypothetical protein